MENGAIIIWVLGGLAAVMAWLVLQNMQHNAKLASIETSNANTNLKLDSLNDKLNLFLKTEIDTLKELVNQSRA